MIKLSYDFHTVTLIGRDSATPHTCPPSGKKEGLEEYDTFFW